MRTFLRNLYEKGIEITSYFNQFVVHVVRLRMTDKVAIIVPDIEKATQSPVRKIQTKLEKRNVRNFLAIILGVLALTSLFFINWGVWVVNDMLIVNETNEIEANLVNYSKSVFGSFHDSKEKETETHFYPGQMRPLTENEEIEFVKRTNPIPNTMGEFMAKPSNKDNAIDLESLPMPSYNEYKKQISSTMDVDNLSDMLVQSFKNAQDQNDINKKMADIMTIADRHLGLEKEETVTEMDKTQPAAPLDKKFEEEKKDLDNQDVDAIMHVLGHIMDSMSSPDVLMLSLGSNPSSENNPEINRNPQPQPLPDVSMNMPLIPLFSPSRFVYKTDFIAVRPDMTNKTDQEMGSSQSQIISLNDDLMGKENSEDGWMTGFLSILFGDEMKDQKLLGSLEAEGIDKNPEEPGDKAFKSLLEMFGLTNDNESLNNEPQTQQPSVLMKWFGF